jgi:hypothetical protein
VSKLVRLLSQSVSYVQTPLPLFPPIQISPNGDAVSTFPQESSGEFRGKFCQCFDGLGYELFERFPFPVFI